MISFCNICTIIISVPSHLGVLMVVVVDYCMLYRVVQLLVETVLR